MSAPHFFELLQWHDAATSNPDSDIVMAVWSSSSGLLSGWFDDERTAWIDCENLAVIHDVTHWADPKGPQVGQEIKPADLHVLQVQAALDEALKLLQGWVAHKCPKRYRAEHLASIAALARAGGLQ